MEGYKNGRLENLASIVSRVEDAQMTGVCPRKTKKLEHSSLELFTFNLFYRFAFQIFTMSSKACFAVF